MEVVADPVKRERVFKGLVGLQPAPGRGTPAFEAYSARKNALPSTLGNATHCDLEKDDDGI